MRTQTSAKTSTDSARKPLPASAALARRSHRSALRQLRLPLGVACAAAAAFFTTQPAEAATLVHRYDFTDTMDPVGSVNGTLTGQARLQGGQLLRNVVHFAGTPQQALQVAAGDNPVGGLANYTIALVFRTSVNGAAGGQWFNNTGLVDAEQGGVTNDWGVVINDQGQIGGGNGNPDQTIYSSGAGLADGAGHIAIFSASASD